MKWRSIALDSADPHAYGVRGLIRREAGRFEDAEADCTQAIQLGLEHPEVYLARAVAHGAWPSRRGARRLRRRAEAAPNIPALITAGR